MSPTIPIFAYGTLKKGHSNAKRTIEVGEHEHVGTGTTVDKFVMRNAGIAFVQKVDVFHKGVQARLDDFLGHIEGDLWLVDDEGLARCDKLEGHPTGYRREHTRVKVGDTVHSAWLYFYPHTTATWGTLEKPDDNGVVRWNDGLHYRKRKR